MVKTGQQPVIYVHLSPQSCNHCFSQAQCTHSESSGYGRTPKLLPQAHHQALQMARQYQSTDEFYERYTRRAGIEGTLSQGVRAFGLRRSHSIGLTKTHLQHLVTAVAVNLARLMNWWEEIPKAPTRISCFAAFAPTPTTG